MIAVGKITIMNIIKKNQKVKLKAIQVNINIGIIMMKKYNIYLIFLIFQNMMKEMKMMNKIYKNKILRKEEK